jgi:hypothetical protein
MKNFTQNMNKLNAAFFVLLLFAFGTANAQTVHFDDPGQPATATSISGLDVDGTTYTVVFTILQEAVHAYDIYPGTYTFDNETDATAAVTAMSAALNSANALEVGVIDGIGYEVFAVIYESFVEASFDACRYIPGTATDNTWNAIPNEQCFYNLDGRNWTIFTPEGSTGINEEFEGTSISIFPNPASDVLYIETEADVQNISLYTMTGQLLRSITVVDERTTIDVSELQSGVYFLSIENEDNVITKKVIIN